MSATNEDACEAIAATEVIDMPDGTKAAIVRVVGSLRALQAKVLEFEKASKGHLATTAARLADEMFAMANGEKPSERATW